jgi:hypothetical protein
MGGGLPTVPPGYPGTAAGYPPGYTQPGYPGAPAAPNPVETAFGGMSPETAKPDGEEGPRLPVRESKLQMVLLLGVVAIALTAAGIAIWYKMSSKPEAISADTASKFKDVNLSFQPPPSPWAQDAETKKMFDAPFLLVYKRENPEAYMAFGARDYKDREPRASELRGVLVKALDKLLERDTRKEYREELDNKFWLGQEVQGFKFVAQQKGGGTVNGDAIAVSHKGVAYWFLAWTPEEMYPEQKSAFAEGRANCKLLDLRKDWKAKQSNIADYKNTEIGYTISDPDGAWDEVNDEDRKKDEGADKLLELTLGKKSRDRQKSATLAVHVLPGGADPMTEARAYVTERRATELKARSPDSMVTFEPRTDAPADQPTNTVEKASEVARFHSRVKNGLNQDRLHAISATKAGDKIVVAHAWCDWAEKDDFEAIFMQICGSLRADK